MLSKMATLLAPYNEAMRLGSDVQARARPEASGLGPAWRGLGLSILSARPSIEARAWSGLAWA